MPTDKPALIVGVADLHTNSVVGLNPLRYLRGSDNYHVIGKIGRALHRKWVQFWAEIAAKKAQHKATAYTFWMGDLGDLISKDPSGLISSNKKEIQDAMAEVTDVGAQVSDHNFIVRGTRFHTGPNGELEEWLASDLANVEPYSEAIKSWWIARASIQGFNIMAAHRPPTGGRRPWTIDDIPTRAAKIVAGQFLAQARRSPALLARMPDICVWAHLHPPYGLFGMHNGPRVRGFILPPWQLSTSYAYGLGLGTGPRNVGGLWMLLKDGNIIDWNWLEWPMDKEPVWTP